MSASSAPVKRLDKKGKIMKNDKTRDVIEEMLPEYNFSKGVRGKYSTLCQEGCNVLTLAPDVAAAFPNAEAVNEALRA